MSGSIEQWERIARDVLVMKDASRSEVESVLIGITQSKDRWLKEQLKKKCKTAWTSRGKS